MRDFNTAIAPSESYLRSINWLKTPLKKKNDIFLLENISTTILSVFVHRPQNAP